MYLRLTLFTIAFASIGWSESAAGISWSAPAGWKSQGQRPMRVATYAVPATAGDKEDGECAVFYFGAGQGGGVKENIDRWLSQFQEKPAGAPPTAKRTVGGIPLTTMEHKGTYLSGGPMSPVKTPKPGFVLLGAIAEGPQGNVFFKLTGPAATVNAARGAWTKMLDSIRK